MIGLLALEVLLLLSEGFQWFAFNEKRGWTMLIAMESAALAIFLMLLWFASSMLFRWRFQYTLRSLLVLILAVAIPFSWLATETQRVKRQRAAVEGIRKVGGSVDYTYHRNGKPPGPNWLQNLLGVDLFEDIFGVDCCGRGVTDRDLEHVGGCTSLRC